MCLNKCLVRAGCLHAFFFPKIKLNNPALRPITEGPPSLKPFYIKNPTQRLTVNDHLGDSPALTVLQNMVFDIYIYIVNDA